MTSPKTPFLILLGVLMISFSSAAFVPIVIPVSSPPANHGTRGCLPPINFSLEHDCELFSYSSKSINSYNCGNYKVTSDCNGNVLKYEKDYNRTSQHIILGVLFIGVISILLTFIKFRPLGGSL